MLNALKAMTAELPRFPHPIQPLVKSDRLDAYRARQIAPATPMSQKYKKTRPAALLAHFEKQLRRAEYLLKQETPGTNAFVIQQEIVEGTKRMIWLVKGKIERERRALPRRRRLHNGRLAKLNRGRR